MTNCYPRKNQFQLFLHFLGNVSHYLILIIIFCLLNHKNILINNLFLTFILLFLTYKISLKCITLKNKYNQGVWFDDYIVKKYENAYVNEYVKNIKVGDIIELEEGEYIPADGHMIEGHIGVIQLHATGQMGNAYKTPHDNGENDVQSSTKVFKGSKVFHGKGKMIVTAIGNDVLFFK